MELSEQTIYTKTLFSGLIFSVDRIDVRLPDGKLSRRDVIRHKGAAAVLAQLPDGTFLLIRQFRKAVDTPLLEIVAGTLDPGEAPEQCARREVEEETGHRVTALTPLGPIVPAPGYTDETIHLFHAWVDPEPSDQSLDHDERIQVVPLTRGELEAALDDGRLYDGKSLAAWALYLRKEAQLPRP